MLPPQFQHGKICRTLMTLTLIAGLSVGGQAWSRPLDHRKRQVTPNWEESSGSYLLTVEEVFSTYDADQDSVLNAEETQLVMEAHKPSSPPSNGMMMGKMMNRPASNALVAEQYERASAVGDSEDLVSTLIALLSEKEDDKENEVRDLNNINTSA